MSICKRCGINGNHTERCESFPNARVAPSLSCGWCRGNPIGDCAICQARPSSPETYADDPPAASPTPGAACECSEAVDGDPPCPVHDPRSAPSSGVDLRRVANDLIDAISTPKGRDFAHAWEEACLVFGRFGAEPTLLSDVRREAIEACAKVVEKQASINRMRAQSLADDSDRADGEAQTDDIDRADEAAEVLEYTAMCVRSLLKGGSDG